MFIYWFNTFALFFTGVIATTAVFSRHFDDNIVQRMGLAIIAMTSFGRVWDLSDGISDIPANSLIYIWKNLGIFLFAFGTYVKFAVRTYVQDRHIEWVKNHFVPRYGRRKGDHVPF